MKEKKIVCLGGGIGTVNLIKGLKKYTPLITVIVSMADEGGSSGRLRRLYNIMPPGDVVSCLAALTDEKHSYLSHLLTYRFSGDRYSKDTDLAGHKLGNLLMVGAIDQTGSFPGAINLLRELFHVKGSVFPATKDDVTISALTTDNKEVHGEETIDLGKYDGNRTLERIFLHPSEPAVLPEIMTALEEADVVIAGPGDLYTTILPVLIIPQIANHLKESKQRKIFIVNVANKPFETRGYAVEDFIRAIEKHLSSFPFEVVITNNNTSPSIPEPFHYSYVRRKSHENSKHEYKYSYKIVESDIVDENFPLYHDNHKLASVVMKNV